jgi:hypothetical protein
VANVEPASSHQLRNLPNAVNLATRFSRSQVEGDVRPPLVARGDYVGAVLWSERMLASKNFDAETALPQSVVNNASDCAV